MTEPLLFADEDFPLDTTIALCQLGFAVVATVETEIRGLSDREQLRRAAEMGAVFISNNYTERHLFACYARELQQAGFSELTAVLLPHEPRGNGSCFGRLCWSPGTLACQYHVHHSSTGIFSLNILSVVSECRASARMTFEL